MTEQELRRQVVARAEAWLGRKEADGSHREIIDIYNQIRPLPRGYKMKYSDPWCAAFVSAVGAACGLTATILPECACDPMIALYRAIGRWNPIEDRSVLIVPGDLIFYDWDKNGTSDHVGIIVEVTAGGYRVIEGNISDAVGYRTVQRNYNLIRGFALPNYAAAAADDNIVIEPPASEPAQPGTPDRDSFELRYRILRYGAGMEGQENLRERVRAVQRNLRSLGFDVGPYGLDGEFGYDTQNAVMAYQRSVGLDPDGEVGRDTQSALDGLR